MVGQIVSHYRITEKIGEGGMGVVYKAEDTRLDRPVALKFLAPHLLRDEEGRKRFEREAKAAAKLDHPNICTVYEIDEVEDKTFIAMAYLAGESLEKKIENGPFKIPDALNIAIQAAQGLEAAHREGIIHRDIKPANLMIVEGGSSRRLVKIMDFGLAYLAGRSQLTKGDTTMGTAPYMSPQQVQGVSVDHRADIWALGVVLYEMITGQRPFKGDYDKAVMYSILSEEYEPITAVRAGVPMDLEWIVGKALAKELEDRYQHDEDMVVDLRSLSKKLASGKSTIVRAAVEADVDAPHGPQPNAPLPLMVGQPENVLANYRVTQELEAEDDSVVYRAEDTRLKRPVAIRILPEASALRLEHRRRVGKKALLAGGVLCAIALLATVILAFVHFTETPRPQRALRFSVPGPEGAAIQTFAVSPDGRYLAFAGRTAAQWQLWVRRLDSLEARVLPGTEGGWFPFWSPDSTYIGFFTDDKLKKIAVTGGPPQTLCDAPNGRGGTWNREEIIVFASNPGPSLYRVSAAGGVPVPVTPRNASEGEGVHRFPQFLPDGRHFLYLKSQAADENGTYLASLDSELARRLLADDSRAEYVPGAPGENGHLLCVREGNLMAQPFDAASFQMTGDLFPVAEQVRVGPTQNNGAFSVSEDGMLVYQGGRSREKLQLIWLDREGKRLGEVGEIDDYSNPALSQDEKKLAVGIGDPTKTRDLWVFDLTRGTSSRLTFDPADDLNPLWSPDDTRIVFTSDRGGQRDIYQKLASGVDEAELLLASEEPKSVEDWSLDGRFVIYNITGPFDVWALPLGGDRKPVPLLTDEFTEHQARLSPNGRWFSYTSNESGRAEVYVRDFAPAQDRVAAPAGGKWQISTAGGLQSAWRRDGKELYYLEGQNLMAVDVTADSAIFEAGIPKVLFEAPPLGPALRNRYVVSRDGQRFLFNTLAEETQILPLTVMVNWRAQSQR